MILDRLIIVLEDGESYNLKTGLRTDSSGSRGSWTASSMDGTGGVFAAGGWTLEEPTVPIPEPKTSFVDVPGANGSLDLTEALVGTVRYSRRECVFPVWKPCASRYEARRAVQELAQIVNGRLVKAYVMGGPPNHHSETAGYLNGRVTKMEYSLTGSTAHVDITALCDPFIYVGETTEEAGAAAESQPTAGTYVTMPDSGWDRVARATARRQKGYDSFQSTCRGHAFAYARGENLLDLSKTTIIARMGRTFDAYSKSNMEEWGSHVWSVEGSSAHICNSPNSTDQNMRATFTKFSAFPATYDNFSSTADRARDALNHKEGFPAFNPFTADGQCTYVVRVHGTVYSAADSWDEVQRGVQLVWYSALTTSYRSSEAWAWHDAHGDAVGEFDKTITVPGHFDNYVESPVNQLELRTLGVSCDVYMDVMCVRGYSSSKVYAYEAPDVGMVLAGVPELCYLQAVGDVRDSLSIWGGGALATKATVPAQSDGWSHATPTAADEAATTSDINRKGGWDWADSKVRHMAACPYLDGTCISVPLELDVELGRLSGPYSTVEAVQPYLVSDCPVLVEWNGTRTYLPSTGGGRVKLDAIMTAEHPVYIMPIGGSAKLVWNEVMF